MTAPAGLAVRTQKRYGWRPDTPDMRDFLLAVAPVKTLPAKVSLRAQMPPVYDQGQLGSCTANSIGAILEFNELKQKEADAATPSRLFIYYNERAMEGTVGEDSGAEIRDGIKSVAQLGAPPESLWPYDIAKFARSRPRRRTQRRAKHEAMRYSRVAQDTLRCRTSSPPATRSRSGSPSTTSFETDVGANGIVPMPHPTRRRSAATRSSRSATRRSAASSTSNAATRGARPGQTTATSGCRPAYLTSSSLASDFWVIEQVE